MSFQRGALGATIVLLVASLAVYLSSPVTRPAELAAVKRAGVFPHLPTSGSSASTSHPIRDLEVPGGSLPRSNNVYAATMSTVVSPSLAGFKERVYVPNSNANTVDVIDPATFKVIDQYPVGAIPHHIAPAYDMHELYVDNEGSSSLTVIDPDTGRPKGSIPVSFPYNLYFTPDGKKAIVVVERLNRIDFRDPHTWQLLKTVDIPWRGIDHMDFSADGSYLLASTEYTGVLVRIDVNSMQITGSLDVGGLPIDVRLAPDGSVFYVTNQGRDGVSIVDGNEMKEVGFIPTGRGAHGLQVSRDTQLLYVSNRYAGSISVIDFAERKLLVTWPVGGSPDMLQLSPDGSQLWFTNRYNASVTVVETDTGKVLARIPVGSGDHGLTYFPNVGRYSTGHNGVYR